MAETNLIRSKLICHFPLLQARGGSLRGGRDKVLFSLFLSSLPYNGKWVLVIPGNRSVPIDSSQHQSGVDWHLYQLCDVKMVTLIFEFGAMGDLHLLSPVQSSPD